MTALDVKAKAFVPAKAPRLRHRDYEFLPAALEILETPLSPLRSVFIPTICLFAAVTLAWAYFGRVDIIATAQGKIQTIGRTKTIQPLDVGRVLKIASRTGIASRLARR